eukprot:INCI608.2.p1 GENE.INCI608.2~~INCI608.2.p1  ORF type:complete len:339 (+),score=49.94 INCI608.2:265-1281(+)
MTLQTLMPTSIPRWRTGSGNGKSFTRSSVRKALTRQRTGATRKKKKNVKLNVMVKDKCRGLVFQLPDSSCAGAINYELELPYKHDIPVVIFCRNAEGADPGDIDLGVRGRLSPALRTTRLKVIAYTGASIPAELRNQGMDWIASSLKLPADEEEYPDETLSLVVVGSAHVGKTSLLQRYVNDEFNPKQGPTMGIDKFTVRKALRLPGRTRDQNFILDMWDTAGEQRYRTVTLAFYNCAHGFAVVFDVTQRKSFEDVKNLWIDNIVQAKHTTPFGVVLVACKCDTPEEEWAIPRKDIMAFVEDNELSYFETSALQSEGRARIDEVFTQLVIRTDEALSE